MADATAVSLRRGTSEEHINFRGNEGEVTVDTTNATVWVHLGNNEQGTPLATANLSNLNTSNASTIADPTTGATTLVLTDYAKTDMSNVTAQSIAGVGIAKSDMSNVNTASLATSLGHAGKNLAYSDGSNIDTAGLAERTNESILSEFGKNLAYSDLTNVETSSIINKLDSVEAYAKTDMSNVNTSALAETDPDNPHLGNNLAYANLSNVETLSAAAKANLNLVGIQINENMTQSLSYSTDSQYPSTKAVSDALNALDTLPGLPAFNNNPNVNLQGYFPYQYELQIDNRGFGYEEYQEIIVHDLVNSVSFTVDITEVDETDNYKITKFSLITSYGSTPYTGTAVHFDTSTCDIVTGLNLTNLQVDGLYLYNQNLDENVQYSFIFNGTDWTLGGTAVTLSDYGISVEGTPEANDELSVEYFTNATFNVSTKATHAEKIQWNNNKPTVQDIQVEEEDGSIAVELSGIPTSIEIKHLIGGELIEGSWTERAQNMTFIPTNSEATLSNAWVIKVS